MKTCEKIQAVEDNQGKKIKRQIEKKITTA